MLNAFVRSIKEECLNRMIFVGRGSLYRAVADYMTHYHHERNHQGLNNSLIQPNAIGCPSGGLIRCHQRLGGMLNFYYRCV